MHFLSLAGRGGARNHEYLLASEEPFGHPKFKEASGWIPSLFSVLEGFISQYEYDLLNLTNKQVHYSNLSKG